MTSIGSRWLTWHPRASSTTTAQRERVTEPPEPSLQASPRGSVSSVSSPPKDRAKDRRRYNDEALELWRGLFKVAADRVGTYNPAIWQPYEQDCDQAADAGDLPALREAVQRWREGIECYCLPRHETPCAPGCLLNYLHGLAAVIARESDHD